MLNRRIKICEILNQNESINRKMNMHLCVCIFCYKNKFRKSNLCAMNELIRRIDFIHVQAINQFIFEKIIRKSEKEIVKEINVENT